MMGPKKLPSATASSAAVRPRTAWFIVILSIEEGANELHVGWKYCDNSVGLYSSSPKGSSSRPAWGKVLECQFKNYSDDQGVQWGHLKLKVGNWSKQKRAFKLAEFNPSLWEMNSLTSKILELRLEGKDELLALYLDLLVHARSFFHHDQDVHDENGFRKDEGGIKVEDLEEKGGTLEDFEEFVQKAMESSLKVSSLNKVMERVEGGTKKRKDTDEVATGVKKSRSEKVEDAKQAEAIDKDGVEQSFIGKYLGRAEVPLENLFSSSKVKLTVNPFKVEGLATNILQRPDPSLLCLTVCPREGSPFDNNNLGSNMYDVIHGRHRLLALKKLNDKGLLTGVVGMEKKLVICYIVRTDCSIMANYSALRGNDLQANYVRKPFLHELLFIIAGLREEYALEKTIETAMRYGRLLQFGHDDLAAVKKLGSWPAESLSKLTVILKQFEKLQTSDAKDLAKRHASTIMKGETVQVPNNLVNKLGKMPSYFFDSIADRVIAKKLSLKEAVKACSVVSSRADTLNLVFKQVPGFSTLQSLRTVFPGKFGNDVLDLFCGAVLEGKGINQKGDALKVYCESVVKDEEIVEKIKMKEIKDFRKVDLSSLPECDTIVINCVKLSESQISQLKMMKARKNSLSLILLISSQEIKFDLISKLSPDLGNLQEIFFTTDKPVRNGDFCQNLQLGIVSCPIVFRPPLMTFNGPLQELESVVVQVTPPSGKIVLINEGCLQIPSIHRTLSCEYVGEKSAMEKMDKNLRARHGEIGPANNEEESVKEAVVGDGNTGEDINDDIVGLLKGELVAGKSSLESDKQEESEEYNCINEKKDAQPGTSGKIIVIKRESLNDPVKPSCSFNS